jgi:polyisoprenoid-binding protein YceI
MIDSNNQADHDDWIDMGVPAGNSSLSAIRLLLTTLILATSAVAAHSARADERFMIDPDASSLHWRVYRAGRFARFGHNHVISVPRPAGSIVLADRLEDSTVELQLAVADLVIDDPALRARYGEDFSSVPSAEDIEGTRANMLGEDVLDGNAYSEIQVMGSGLSGLGEGQTIDLRITLLGRRIDVTVPVDVRVGEAEIHASGEFRLTHEDLGMTPFSVMLGALQVGNELDFSYDILALMVD